MNFSKDVARNILIIKAARQVKNEIEKATTDVLETLAKNGTSIVSTYLDGCSAREKEGYRRDFNLLLQWGVKPEDFLEEVIRQIPVSAPIIEGNKVYKDMEVQSFISFLKGG